MMPIYPIAIGVVIFALGILAVIFSKAVTRYVRILYAQTRGEAVASIVRRWNILIVAGVVCAFGAMLVILGIVYAISLNGSNNV